MIGRQWGFLCMGEGGGVVRGETDLGKIQGQAQVPRKRESLKGRPFCS